MAAKIFQACDHPEFTTQVFKSALLSRDFSDVTLVGEEGVQLPAHKIVLSGGSTYFRRVLGLMEGTLVVLPDVSTENLTNLLTYLYTGQARVTGEAVEEFLRLARRLGVVGLEGGEDNRLEVVLEEMKNKVDRFQRSEDRTETDHRSQLSMQTKEPEVARYHGIESRGDSGYSSPFAPTPVPVAMSIQKLQGSFDDFQKTVRERQVHGVDQQPCSQCGKMFFSYLSLRQHKNNEHISRQ